ncbi:MAG TPA: tetratricopeptide repeat protein [Burkholderiales bacterium]|nr:tetratricopeptide repeat protein [Burkholderiales bacterium]
MTERELIEQGLDAHRAGRLAEAKRIYEQILGINPRHPDALHLLGLAELQGGDPRKALALIEQALAEQPENWAFRANRAAALRALGRYREAFAAYEQMLPRAPEDPQLALAAAGCLAQAGEPAQAEQRLRALARRFPALAAVWFDLGNAVRDQGRLEEAAQHYRRALELDGSWPDAWLGLGSALHGLERLAEAERCFREALARAPADARARFNLGSVLIDRGRFAEAERECRRLLAATPEWAAAHSLLASALGHQGRLLDSLEPLRRACALDPEDARAAAALALALLQLGREEEAAALLPRLRGAGALAEEVHDALASAHLAAGRWSEGWRQYAHRVSRARARERHPGTVFATALPQPLPGKHLIVRREQGLGDELFFLRFAPLLRARGARITYLSGAKLASLLARSPALDTVVAESAALPSGEAVLLAGDLPLALLSTPGLGEPCPALAPPFPLAPLPDRLAAQRAALARLGPPPYLGLTWRAGTPPAQVRGAHWVLFKQAPLEAFGAALRGLEATLLALQRHPEPGEIERLAQAAGRPVHDLSALNEDLEAMLALLAVVDDYIGVSNTNMHLRAGVGKTARVLVPCPAEWRWMASGEESPWFPGFRIYRQKPDGDWSEALARLAQELRAAFGPSGK